MENNERNRYRELEGIFRELEIYSPKVYRVRTYINQKDYGVFLMKQRYDKDFLKENNLKNTLIFSLKEGDGIFTNQTICNTLDQQAKEVLERQQIKDRKELMDSFDNNYIAKLKELGHRLRLENDFFISDNTVYLYRGDNKKIYPIIDPLLLEKGYTGEINYIDNKEKLQSPPQTPSIKAETNSLKKLLIGEKEADIDHDNRVIFIRLEKGAASLQKISYEFSNEPVEIFIDLPLDDGGQEWIKIEQGNQYDFESFIYRGQLSYINLGKRDIYDLYITTGDVPIIEISTSKGMEAVVEIDISNKVPCDIRFLSKNKEQYNNKIIKGAIEISGKTQKDKKNFSIKIDKKYKLEGMVASKTWILDGGVFDPSHMRKKLTYDFLRQIHESDGIPINIPEVRYTEVILNGEYQGLYTLSNKIDEEFLNLDDFKSYEKNNDLLYKSVNINSKFVSENIDTSIYSKEYKDFPYGLQPKRKDLDPLYGWHSGYEQKWPNTKDYGEYWEPFEELIETVTLSSEEEFNDFFKLVDREKFINLWILMWLQNNLNGTDYGQYIVRDGKDAGGWYFIPWETNPVFCRDKEVNKVEYNTITFDNMFDKSMEINSFNRDFVDQWWTLRNRGIITGENYGHLIENNLILIEDSQKRNSYRWPNPEEENFYEEVEYIKEWIKERINWVDLHFRREGLDE